MSALMGEGDDPLDALKAMRARRSAPADAPTGEPDPLEQLKALKGGSTAPPTGIHAEYASGALAKRMASENAADAAPGDDGSASTLGAFGRSLAATGANLAQGIPGMRAAEAGARSVVRTVAHKVAPSLVDPESYREALSNITGEVDKLPTTAKVAGRMAGGAPLAMMLPGSAAVSGALIGGADQALDANPDMSLTERGVRTAAGAAGGALLGKGGERLIAAGKAFLPGTKNAAALLLEKQAARAQSAKGLYDAAMAEGRLHEATPAIQQFVSDPDIQDIVSGLQQTHALRGKAAESPEMLDAIYKTLSDQAQSAKKGLNALTPNKPNIGRFTLADIKAKQQQLIRAMGSPGTKAPLSLDVAPEVFETAPKITPGREPAAGPVMDGPLSKYATGPNPPIREALDRFHQGLPGHPQAWLAERASTGTVQGPAGPAFQMRGQPGRVTPGVRIETPAMRVETAPARQVPAMMPTYEHAVQDYAKRTAEIEAAQKGYDAFRGGLSENLPTAKNLTRKTPEAFAEWVKTASPAEVMAARQGVIGGARMSFHGSANPLKLFGVPGSIARAGSAAPLLRAAHTPSQDYLDILQNLGLLTAGASTP